MLQSQIKQIDDSAYLRGNMTHSSQIHSQTRLLSCPAKAITDPLVPSSPTLLCPAELILSPLSSTWKAKGNGSPTGNIRTGTQSLHLLASRLLRTPVLRTWDGKIKGWIGSTRLGRECTHQIPNPPTHLHNPSHTVHWIIGLYVAIVFSELLNILFSC